MKWAAEEISPAQIVLLRAVFGFLPVFLYALSKGALRWQHIHHANHFVVMALLVTAIYYFAFANGIALLPSSIAGLLSGAIPLFTFLCAWLFLREEHINAAKAAGVALGFVGVLLIARPWSGSGGIDATGVVYMIAGSLSVGCSFVYARRFISPLNLPAEALTTYQIGLAIVFLLIVTSVDGIDAVFRAPRAWIGLVFGLGLCGTGLAYLAYYHVVANLGAVAASCVTYIPPIVALVIGAVMVGDEVHPLGYVAMLLILSGVAALQFGSRGPVHGQRSNQRPVRDNHE
jgi:drug/metabolite transporter (DMT)-like permease